jgi:hypothetical protein
VPLTDSVMYHSTSPCVVSGRADSESFWPVAAALVAVPTEGVNVDHNNPLFAAPKAKANAPKIKPAAAQQLFYSKTTKPAKPAVAAAAKAAVAPVGKAKAKPSAAKAGAIP